VEPEQPGGLWDLSKCRRAYTTYLDSKRLEIEEQQSARRYRHGVQWTADQVKALNDRKQPVVTYNRIGRKIDGIVGLVERLKQDPKAFPRTPRHQQGADLATAVLRYLMDANRWDEKASTIAEAAAVDGLAGLELDLIDVPAKPQQQMPPPQMPPPQMGGNVVPFPGMGHNGGPPMEPPPPDKDVVFNVVDNDGFFYDPRSFKHDFSDARYLGMGKFVDQEILKELMPQFADQLEGNDVGADLTSNSDRDQRWFQNTRDFYQVRLVDLWYRHERGWCWALFTGSTILMQGRSPFRNDKGEEIPKYQMFSAAVDQDGDRYGFPRNLMSAQDEINQRRSKALHELNSRRIRATKAAVADGNVEALRREAQRADGIVLTNTSLDDIQFDDMAKQAAIMGQLEFLKEAKAEIENFGPNPALVGEGAGGVGGNSGRAIQLLQQAGIAELGPYMINLRSWKIRVYRALFNAAQQHWTNQRWIRVTDSQGKPQFVEINGMQPDPMTGMPTVTNAIGELDVDIVLDEGPDSVTVMQDTYDTISQALPAVAKLLSPAQVTAAMEALIETSPLPEDVKKKFRDAGAQPPQPPPEQQAKMAELQMQQQHDAAKLQMEQQHGQAKLAIEAQSKSADLQHKQQASAMDIQTTREKAAADIQIAREKAQADIEIEQFKALQKAQHDRNMLLSGMTGPPHIP
jgi:hypothetical protein